MIIFSTYSFSTNQGGDATCTAMNSKVALCGCRELTGTTAQFSFGKASIVLIKSAMYRKAVSLLNEQGHLGSFKSEYCSGLSDGSIFQEAGYDVSLGSFYDVDSATTSGEESALGSSSSSEDDEYAGSCMGAPCTK